MIEVQCPSCQTRYRIDEGVLPEDNPTFKCSRCGHVFSGDPRRVERPSASAPVSAPLKITQPTSRASDGLAAAPKPATATPVPDKSDSLAPNPDALNSTAMAKLKPRAAAKPPPAAPPPAQPASKQAGPPGHEKEDNPLARSFAEDEPRIGENFTFVFREDADHSSSTHPPEEAAATGEERQWQVGAPLEQYIHDSLDPEGPDRLSHEDEELVALPKRPVYTAPPKPLPPPPARKIAVHSSLFFLGVFFLIVIFFGLLSLLMMGAPEASRELLTHMPVLGDHYVVSEPSDGPLISLSDLRTEHKSLEAGHDALIITGRAQNLGTQPLHTIQIWASLNDAAHRTLARQTIYCGNLLTTKMVSEMTAREREFFQKLEPPRNFVLKGGESTPFLVLFVDPPAGAIETQVGVAQTQAASDQLAAQHAP